MSRMWMKFTKAEQSQMWERWRAGESISEISTALSRSQGIVRFHLCRNGGIAPPARTRRPEQLSLKEREEISRGLAADQSLRAIARELGRNPSTISREVCRNGGKDKYRACEAEKRAWKTASRPKPCRLQLHPRLRRAVAKKLALDWSPEQIAGWLSGEFPNDPDMQISHETIYRSLFIQTRGVLKKELMRHLRTGRKLRRSRKAARPSRGGMPDAVSIRERPAEAEDRAVPGHWEGDLLAGSNNTYVATLVERQSRFAILVRVDGKDTSSVTTALIKQMRKLPEELKRSLTWDRGTEMAQHKRFTLATDIQVYFCDPQSPWQRGSNENTNGLLRQYMPKGQPVDQFSQADLNRIARRLNTRPRKTLGFKTPAAVLNELLR